MDLPWLEGLSLSFYERVGFDPSYPASTFDLAWAWLGSDAIERPANMVTPSATFVIRGQRRIAVRRSVPAEYAYFFAGHELGHLLLAEEGYQGEDEEQCANALGAALLAPLPAVRRMLRAFGRDHVAMAEECTSTQTWAALRIAEALGIPRAVITPARVYVRGPEEFVWGTERDLRQRAKGRAGPGITKVRLRDDPKRVVVTLEEAG